VSRRQLEFDFIVAPGAIPAAIRLGVTGAQRIATDDAGNLILGSAAGDVLLHKQSPTSRKMERANQSARVSWCKPRISELRTRQL